MIKTLVIISCLIVPHDLYAQSLKIECGHKPDLAQSSDFSQKPFASLEIEDFQIDATGSLKSTNWRAQFLDFKTGTKLSLSPLAGARFRIQLSPNKFILTTSYGYDLVHFIGNNLSGKLRVKAQVSSSYNHGGPAPVLAQTANCRFTEESNSILLGILEFSKN